MRRPALLALLLLLSGCVATTRTLDVADAASRQAISERAGRQRAVVTVRDRPAVEARGLRIDADSTSWIGADGAVHVVPTADVDRVAFAGVDPRGRLSRLEGFALGFAAAAVGGAVLTHATYEPQGFIDLSPTAMAVISGVVYGIGGGGVGASVANGQPERFVLAPPRPATVR
ncbi:hypothetical protein RQM47_01675 [Rubrivirga sp. S365]|uniref:Lipoprotein n=1 Tax=Rubrivirga litoralis TaxID=3075598 RepID=A0ABU3BPC0_9BACT|nr:MULTISPECIES: hypothetical protein [unclassified Rubrivirga]MDT0631144.1 hypothetical protein [Rubrivirga sp. F394]MDT7855343.1 hypothetical protein [Rubrivirga sp. S365]